MIKEIHVEKNILRLVDREPFLLPDILTFRLKTVYDLKNAFITFKNGKEEAHFKVTGSEIIVPANVLFSGLLHYQVDIYYNGEIIKTLIGSPLKIMDTDKNIVIFDALADLEKRVLALEKQHEII